MRKIIALAVCMLSYNAVFAQFPQVDPPKRVTVVKEKGKVVSAISFLPQKPKNGFKKNAIGGYFTDIRRQPVKGVRTFIYLPDSSISASGYSDGAGYYETNSIAPGFYDFKIVYPGTKATTQITGVPVMQGYITEISLRKYVLPEADTVIEYKEIAPTVDDKYKN